MKQVIVVNQSLKLPKGKLAAQAAHASVGAFVEAEDDARVNRLEEGMPKVVLQVPETDDLLRLYDQALQDGLPACLVEDAGRTVVPAGTLTCLGIGPARDDEIDRLTGELKLL
jgi:peptidyl-tRNA hydrolase, PTH2 family